MIEDSFPDHFRRVAFHPSAFVYAWKRKDLDKLFEELNLSNIAIISVEAWKVEKGVVEVLIPINTGDIQIFSLKNSIQDGEEWNDFVNRSTKTTLEVISDWSLERSVVKDQIKNIYYHFEFQKE